MFQWIPGNIHLKLWIFNFVELDLYDHEMQMEIDFELLQLVNVFSASIFGTHKFAHYETVKLFDMSQFRM